MSRQFENKTREIKNGIPDTQIDPLRTLRKAMEKWNLKEQRSEFKLRKVSLQEIIEIIGNLKNSKTMGHDEINPLVIKLLLELWPNQYCI